MENSRPEVEILLALPHQSVCGVTGLPVSGPAEVGDLALMSVLLRLRSDQIAVELSICRRLAVRRRDSNEVQHNSGIRGGRDAVPTKA